MCVESIDVKKQFLRLSSQTFCKPAEFYGKYVADCYKFVATL
jgi:hypothetical protein